MTELSVKLGGLSWVEESISFIREHRWGLTGAVLAGGALYWAVSRPRKLPPGPRGWPLIGGMLELGTDLHTSCERLRKIHGNVFSVNVLGSTLVFLCDADSMKEALVKEEFSHRLISTALKNAGMQDDIFMGPYDGKWKENKKFLVTTLRAHGFGTVKGEGKILEQIERICEVVKEKEGEALDPRPLCEKAAANVLFDIMFSFSARFDHPELLELTEAVTVWATTFNSSEIMIIETCPTWVAKLMSGNAQKQLNLATASLVGKLDAIIKRRMETFDPGHIRDVVDAFIAERGAGTSSKSLADIIAMFTPEAVHSVCAALAFILFYMAKHAHVQVRVQAQLDSAVGASREVRVKDRQSLPLVEAVLHESLRIAPPAPISPPRVVTTHTTVAGYHLPAGTSVIPNYFAAHMSERHFETPEKFNIEHFLHGDGSFRRSEAWCPFGIGRRTCIGEQLTRMELFLMSANLLKRYKITFPEGFEPYDDLDWTSELVVVPKPFKIHFTER